MHHESLFGCTMMISSKHDASCQSTSVTPIQQPMNVFLIPPQGLDVEAGA